MLPHLVGEMLAQLNSGPGRWKEVRAVIDRPSLVYSATLWLARASMYGAGRLESRNVREYETAARYARDSGHDSFIERLLTMAEVEWEHEFYFRSRVKSHRWGTRLRLWQPPPPKETIRGSFGVEEASASVPGLAEMVRSVQS